MKTLFIAAGPESWASARMRAYWPARYLDGAAVVDGSTNAFISFDFGAYVFQKLADVEAMHALREHGKRVAFDVCDPAWWWHPAEYRAIVAEADVLVASSAALAADLAEWSGRTVHTIPDRLELAHFPLQRTHADVAPVRLIWFGLSVNRPAAFAAMAVIERLAANGYPVELTICDDRPDAPEIQSDRLPVYYTRWSLEQENAILAAHDIAVLPKLPGAWGKVKSNNKRLTAWACGLPVIDGEDYLAAEGLVTSCLARQVQAADGLLSLMADYRVEQSAVDWEQVLSQGWVPCA